MKWQVPTSMLSRATIARIGLKVTWDLGLGTRLTGPYLSERGSLGHMGAFVVYLIMYSIALLGVCGLGEGWREEFMIPHDPDSIP